MTQSSVRVQAAVVAIAPAVLLAGLWYHPFIRFIPDAAAVSEAAASDPQRWGVAHLAVAVGSGLLTVAFLFIHRFLRDAGDERWSAPALPFIVMAGTLYALLPGMEFAPLAAAKAGASVRAAQEALRPWFVPTLMAAAVTFSLGVLGFARAISASRVLGPGVTRFVVSTLVVMAVTRFVPLAIVQFYLGGAAGIAALWPLAYRMWTHTAARSADYQRALPAV
jgi:hypothetical protein